MAHYSKNSKLSTEAVLQAAVEFFGPKGLGLHITEQQKKPTTSCCIFKGSSHVSILARKKGDGSEVELEIESNNQQISDFLEKI
ncbi:MAG TPA: hypothetical protein DCX22_02145 [Dehalococcoidia bacterium]|nr:hypothetical protein [Dehalococcoidia bacterium]